MAALVVLIIISLAIISYVLINPVHLGFAYDFDHKTASVSIKFYPISHSFIPGGKRETEPGGAKAGKRAKKIKKRGRIGAPDLIRIFFDEFDACRIIIKQAFAFVIGVIQSPDRYAVNISLNGGLGSPDLTGGLFGLIESIKPILGRSIAIAYRPDFLDDSIRGNILGDVRIRLYRLLKELLILTWKLPKLKMIRIYRKLRKGGSLAK